MVRTYTIIAVSVIALSMTGTHYTGVGPHQRSLPRQLPLVYAAIQHAERKNPQGKKNANKRFQRARMTAAQHHGTQRRPRNVTHGNQGNHRQRSSYNPHNR